MKVEARKAMAASSEPAAVAEGRPERWSAARKAELTLRLLRGEALDSVSRDSQVLAHRLETWKRVFLEAGTRGPATTAAVSSTEKRGNGR